MKYKGYHGQVTYDEEAKLFHGEVVGLRDVITFQGTSVDELEQAFKDSVNEYLDFCKELGRDPEKPFSGKLMLRLPPEIHERAAYEARNSGVSLNAWLKHGIQHLLTSPPDQKPPHRKHV
jgi:predicted HicB family RNase H-like nuclease